MSEYFPELKSLGRGRVKVELDLSSYASKTDFENATGIDASFDLANLKSNVDKLDIHKLLPVLVDLSKQVM